MAFPLLLLLLLTKLFPPMLPLREAPWEEEETCVYIYIYELGAYEYLYKCMYVYCACI